MRLPHFISFACATFLTSCAYEGVIVQKDATPLPFTHTAGIEGSYAFLLRDTAGAVHRQIVTPEVYNQYAIGEYFNDLQPASAARRDAIDPKVVRTAMNSASKPGAQIATVRKQRPAHKLAAKPRPAAKAVAIRAAPVAPKPATVATRPRVVAAAPIAPAGKAVTPVAGKPLTASTSTGSKAAGVVARRPQPTNQKMAPAPAAQPYRPPTASDEPTIGFITVARCR